MEPAAEQLEFLEARLARCRAIPAEERSPEVAAFVETAQLQQEAAAAMEGRPPRSAAGRRQRQLLFALRMAKSNFLCLDLDPLDYSPTAVEAAKEHLAAMLPAGAFVGRAEAFASGVSALLQRTGYSLETLLAAAAYQHCWEPHSRVPPPEKLLRTANAIVERLRQPAEAERLRRELREAQAGLPAEVLSFEQLLALFAKNAWRLAQVMMRRANANMLLAQRNAEEIFARLVPHKLDWRFLTALGVGSMGPLDLPRISAGMLGLRQAVEQGSDYVVARCGHQLAEMIRIWVGSIPVGLQQFCAPSALLGWLRQAREAQRRCEALLPRQWTYMLASRWETAKQLRPWLQQLQAEGDVWRPMEASAAAAVHGEAVQRVRQHMTNPGAGLLCTSCGRQVPHLKTCSGCRASQYCSTACQRAHWPAHKAECRAAQAVREREREGRQS